jgi:hypothetical protein
MLSQVRAECPLCVVALEEARTPTCPRCGLVWRAPSKQSIRLEPESPRSSSRAVTTRPDLGIVFLNVVGFPLIVLPVAIVIVVAVFDGGSKDLIGRLVAGLFALALGFFVLSKAWDTLVDVLAPYRIDEDDEVVRVRLGGLGRRGRREIPIAKADLRDAVLEPRKDGRRDVWIVHKAGPAFLVVASLPPERAEKLGARVRSWFGEKDAGYRARAAASR